MIAVVGVIILPIPRYFLEYLNSPLHTSLLADGLSTSTSRNFGDETNTAMTRMVRASHVMTTSPTGTCRHIKMPAVLGTFALRNLDLTAPPHRSPSSLWLSTFS